MKINKLSKDIYEIEDFISKEECTEILSFITSLNEEDWWIAEREEDKQSFWYGKQYHGPKPDILNPVLEKIQNLFESAYNITGVAIQRAGKDQPMQEHRDYWLYEREDYVRYGIVLYYNDNYEGGEIGYSELGIVHKPKSRSLVLHGGNILHGPLPVTSDDFRYFSTSFVYGTTEQPVILNQKIFADIHEEDGSKYGRA